MGDGIVKSRFCQVVRGSPTAREFLSEMLSTYILMVFGIASVAQFVLSRGTAADPSTINWGWGLGVMLGVYAGGGVSGAHMNPAVTLALACIGKLPFRKVPVYFLGQYLGSFFAACCVFGVYHDALDDFDGGKRMTTGPLATSGIFSTFPKPFLSAGSAFGDQVFGTMMLQLALMGVTDSRNMKIGMGLLPLSAGFIVVAIGMTLGFNCGYAINPARDLSPRIFTAMAGWGSEPFSFRNYNWFWIPILGPHVGAIIGAFMYQLLVGYYFPEETQDQDSQNQDFQNQDYQNQDYQNQDSQNQDLNENRTTEDLQPDVKNRANDKGNNYTVAFISSPDFQEHSKL